jgi:hypothetical protein
VTYVRARCYPVPDGYRVEFQPTGGAIPGPGWPRPRTHPTLASAMAWAYAITHTTGLHLDGLTLMRHTCSDSHSSLDPNSPL